MRQRVTLTLILFFLSVGLASAFQVPDTGIEKCYDAVGNQIFPCPGPGDAYYGQDGNIIHNGMSFTDNGNDTLTDNVTGLLWQKAADGNSRTWDDAVTHCSTLGSGWRVPALVELDSIMDLSVTSDAAAINPIFTGTEAAAYWTSTEDPDNSGNAWIMDFGTTEDGTFSKTGTGYVRCVWTEVTP